MHPIPLAILTMYADLQQGLAGETVYPGSISRKTVRGVAYLYAVERRGSARVQRYLGPADDHEAIATAEAVQVSARLARQQRTTVAALKRARLPSPLPILGRILDALAAAGIFRHGAVLVGTAAFGLYAPVIGAYVSGASMSTSDADLSLAEFTAPTSPIDLEAVLRQADPGFRPLFRPGDPHPPFRFRAASVGYDVDLLTKLGRHPSPVAVPALKASAEAFPFQDWLVADAIEAVALHGRGVLVRVPAPARYAVHKLLTAPRRPDSQAAKRTKDLAQADELIAILAETDPDALMDALDDARSRAKWATAINSSLRMLGRTAQRQRLPQKA